MKFCPRCNSALEDSAKFCTTCGANFVEQAQEPQPQQAYNAANNAGAQYAPPYQGGYNQPPVAPVIDAFDHTAEFDANDISENKVIAMLIYLSGIVGILIALLSQNKSEYVAFHLRQELKIMVCSALSVFLAIVPFIGVFAMGIAIIILAVVQIICFFDVCKGKAKEPAIVRNIKFLK